MKFKRAILSAIACVLSLMMTFAFAACGDGNTGSKVESVTLDITTVTMGPGDTQRLKATVKLADGKEGEVEEWTTSAENVATVTRGVVAAKAAGAATITAKAGDKTATCTVTVEDIKVELNKTTLSLEKGHEETLTATVKKNDAATADKVVWTSSDEKIATVDENGKITAKREGEVTITATRKDANQKASCAVTVTWTKPDGYKEITYYEQNKVPSGDWGYWNDPADYVGGQSEMIESYYQSSANSEAGKVNFSFVVSSRKEADFNKEMAIIQITYRNASETGEGGDGKLITNHNYELSFDLTSNVAGKIGINTIGQDPLTPYDIVAGTNHFTVNFRHGDWDVIYPDGDYTNIESAAYFLLGQLGELGQEVNVSIDNFKWVDKGEADQKTEKPDFTPPAIPDLSATEAIAMPFDTTAVNEKYVMTTADSGKSYKIVYTNVESDTYEGLAFDIPEAADAANCNTLALTVKNDGEATVKIRLNLKGTVATQDPNGLDIFECGLVSIVDGEGGSVSTDTTWGGTNITVEAGKTVTVYITYEANGAHGVPTVMEFCIDTAYENEAHNKHSGDVTFSNFKFANVTEEE